MAKKDYYDILGISRNASEAEIKSAYRKLARSHHPDIDKSSGSAEKFKEISEAYQVLADAGKRKTYDQFGSAAFQSGAGGFGGAQGWPFGGNQGGFRSYSYSTGGKNPNVEFNFGGFTDPFELFEQIFGGGFTGASPFGRVYKQTPTYQLELTFEEAIKGAEKQIQIEDEAGQVKKMTIKIPAGVDSGTRMRFSGADLVFRVRRHPEFLREGADIFSEITVKIPQLVLGDIVEVATIWGKVNLKIPTGTEPGSLIRIKERGVPYLRRTGKGDHYVRVKVTIPNRLSSEEKRLYEELLKLSHKKKSWF